MKEYHLRVAAKAERVIETKWESMSFEEALNKLEGQVGRISRYRLQTFLKSGERRMFTVTKHEETAKALDEWLMRVGEGGNIGDEVRVNESNEK